MAHRDRDAVKGDTQGPESEPGTAGGGNPGPADALELETVREDPDGAPILTYRNHAWEERFPGLRCGITGARTREGRGADFGLAASGSSPSIPEEFRGLAEQLGFEALAVTRQVHGSRWVRARVPAGYGRGAGRDVSVVDGADGLVSTDRGLLLAVTAADCVPVHLLAPASGVFGLFHAGWRGTAAGMLEAGLGALRQVGGAEAGEVHVHLGPAICGECYEVGPEVFAALGMSRGRGVLDLRKELARRAVEAGVRRRRVSVSAWCTRCAADRFHSHRGRGESAGRMAAFMGFRATTGSERSPAG